MTGWNESQWFAMLIGVALKSAAILMLAGLVAVMLRRGSAALRHLVWTAAAAAILLMPLFSVSLPSNWIPSVETMAPGVVALFETTSTAAADVPATHASDRPTAVAPHGGARRLTDWRLLVMAIWAAGVFAACLQVLFGIAGLWRLRRTASPSPDGMLAKQLARELGISRTIRVVETSEGAMPMTAGLLRPVIFMPCDAEAWSYDRRRSVLFHELAHIRRGDIATQMIARLALILHWWNPLAWFAWRAFLKERERAADDLVLAAGALASDYASHLLEVARSRNEAPALAWAAVAMARRSQLEGRLIAILDSHVNRRPAGRWAALAAAVLSLALAAPFAALRAQDQASPDKSSPAVTADIDSTIRAAAAQKNHEMLEAPAQAFEARRDYDSAKKLLDAALTIRQDVSGPQSVEYGAGLIKIGDLEKRRHNAADAESFYSKALQVLGDRHEAAPALMYLGIAAIGKKNYAQAIDYFQRARNLDGGDDGLAQMWMAIVNEREKNFDQAETLYRSALAVESPTSGDAATTMESFGRFLKEQNRSDESKIMADRAASVRSTLGAPRPQATDGVYRIGNGVMPPRVLSKVEPEYTDEARAAKYQGTVVLSVEIGADGYARNFRVLRGLGLGLDRNAIDAVSQWQFSPATKDGAAVPVWATIEVNFRLL